MKPTAYAELLKDLQALEKRIARDGLVRAKSTERPRAERWHQESETGGRFDDFAAVLAGRSAVQFLLRTVYVRVLEDLGLLTEPRIRGRRGFQTFREVAPSLGVRAYFAYVFRDLAVDFPALFTPGDELDLPDEALCQDVWNLWHAEDGAGHLRYDWQGEGFDSRFLGDLYQDLDADVRKRFALLQTPDFVEKYILDHTLTPAMAEFEAELLGGTFRIIDPTCGSGHFLVGAFHRLAAWWQGRGLDAPSAVERALDSVWGCDINPHAVHIASFRLLLEASARLGETLRLDTLAELATHLHLRALDSLIPWEGRGQLHLPVGSRLDEYATGDQREENKIFLDRPFHVVVGNPPYITPKDVRKRDDYRHFWPQSAAGKYGLTAPFVERLLVLGAKGGFMGQITGNAFLKRSFGKSLIEKVLPQWDVTDIIDTSGAYIPGHGTPTVILIARCRPPTSDQVRVLGGKRGEPGAPAVAAEGKVWRAIVEAGSEPDDSNVFITVIQAERAQYAVHPWNLGGGGAVELQETIEEGWRTLESSITSVGVGALTLEDQVFTGSVAQLGSSGLPSEHIWKFGVGEDIRDYDQQNTYVLFPYDDQLCPAHHPSIERSLWPYRERLRKRIFFGKTQIQRGLAWFEYAFLAKERLHTRMGIAFAFVATHNHFVLDRGGKVFNRTAPVIKLSATATLDDHLDLLGLLNSSTLCFWMKQIFFNKGDSTDSKGARVTGEAAFDTFEFDSTKLQRAPITDRDRAPRITLATALDAHAQARAACRPAAVLAAWTGGGLSERLAQAEADHLSHTQAMVALQEELDWLTYASYGLIEAPEAVTRPRNGLEGSESAVASPRNGPEGSESVVTSPRHGPEGAESAVTSPRNGLEGSESAVTSPRHGLEGPWAAITSPGGASIGHLAPGHRPFEILLARHNAVCDDEERSGWFARHGHDEVTEVPTRYGEAMRARIQARIDLIEQSPELQLLEQPQFKRRWQPLDFADETRKATADWLLDRLEDFFQTAPPRPHRLEEIVLALRRDPRVEEVAAVYAATAHPDLESLLEGLLGGQALPDNPYRLYTEKGIEKWRAWQATWALQDREDAGESVKIEPPPEFDAKDFKHADHFRIRGRLNVPRERFILFADLKPTQYGWNGWRDLNRALAQEQAYSQVEQDPHDPLPAPTSSDPRRCGPTLGLWEALPDVKRWGRAEDHGELLALAQSACGQKQCPCDVVEAWQATLARVKGTRKQPERKR
jgi:hypothetical protein